ncbi:MAG: hypothetical protein KIT08_01485 [Anaerolineales bacterium]|nr:MAG: hypothetical protein KIT08_01485 [Anaerolineales bacterium]
MRIPQVHISCDEPGCPATLIAADSGNPAKLDNWLRSKGWAVMLGKHDVRYEYCPKHHTGVSVLDLLKSQPVGAAA